MTGDAEDEVEDPDLQTKMAGSETLPIKSLQELFSWKPRREGPPERDALIPRSSCTFRLKRTKAGKSGDDRLNGTGLPTLSFQPVPKNDSPRVLVCHDMRGGYLEDRFDGGRFGLPNEPYRFVHWALVDTFVYFSHHLVTVPPWGWVHAAHRNGVEILGTFITESDEGAAICREVLSSRATVDKVVEVLCRVAATEGFDGWLLNIENTVDEELVPNLVYLAGSLTKAMKSVNPASKVIWYDSVTANGVLAWQNKLNSENFPFFDVCDGIYLNYAWSPKDLEDTVQHLNRTWNSNRRHAVYVGVDVFGRGVFGGGGFDCDKAVQRIVHDRDLSVAIFAPAWTHECVPPDDLTASSDETDDFRCFPPREYKFWKLLQDLLNFRGFRVEPDKDGEFRVRFSSGVALLTSTRRRCGSYGSDNSLVKRAEGGAAHVPEGWCLNFRKQSFQPTYLAHPLQTTVLKQKHFRPGKGVEDEGQDRHLAGDPFYAYLFKDVDLDVTERYIDRIHRTTVDHLVVGRPAASRDWMFYNRICVVPLFVCEIPLHQLGEKARPRLIFRIICSCSSNRLPRPHLILAFTSGHGHHQHHHHHNHKAQNQKPSRSSSQRVRTVKLCPRTISKDRVCYHVKSQQSFGVCVPQLNDTAEGVYFVCDDLTTDDVVIAIGIEAPTHHSELAIRGVDLKCCSVVE